MRLPDSLAPLRSPGFAWFYSARVVSTAGSSMAPIALAFAVLDVSGSASALGIVLAARTLPMVVFLLVGGVIADRFPRDAVLRVSNVLAGLTQAAVAALVISGHAEIWTLVLLEAANGVVSAFTMPAMEGVVPQLAPRDHLQQANALLSFSRSGLQILGPTLAAVLVAGAGSGWALAVDAASWLLAAALLTRVRLPRRTATPDARHGMLHDLREGWGVFRGTTWLWVVVVGFAVMNAIHAGAWYTLGPALARDTFGVRGWGFVLSAESVGMLLMTLVMLRITLRRPLRAGMCGMLVFVVPLLVLGLDGHVVPLVVVAFLAGAGIEVFSIGWAVAMQENVEERLLSRAYSYDALGSFVAIPVGQVVFGPLGDAFGFRNVLVASGLVYLATVLLVLSSRSVRSLGRAPAEPASVTAPSAR